MIPLLLYSLGLLITLLQPTSSVQNRCVPSRINPKACMCNSTYCDETPPIEWCQDQWELHTYLTSDDGHRFHHSLTYFRIPGKNKEANFTIILNPCKTHQKIIGFGGAMTDSAALMISCLSRGAKQNLMSSYFDCETGIGYNIIRVPFGASDFSEKPYTYDDIGLPDPELKLFALNKMDAEYKIPLIKLAKSTSCNEIHLKAATWKAPKWMTKSETANVTHIFNTGMLPEYIPTILPHVPSMFQKFERTCMKEEYMNIYANYLSRVLQEYRSNDLNFSFISGGNEVHFAYVSDCWDKETYKNWIANDLCPILKQNGFDSVKILALDDQTLFLPEWQKILEDSEVESCIAGFATHWYLEHIPGLSIPIEQDFCKRYPEKILINSESAACDYESDYVRTSDWEKARRYAIDIIDRLSTCNHGYIDYNLALNLQGGPNHMDLKCYSAIAVDCKTDEFYKKILFYVLGHFSKFVPENSTRIDIKIESAKPSKLKPVKAVAFEVKNVYCQKENLVAIILNQNNVDLNINICIGEEQCGIVRLPKNSIISTVMVMPSYFTCE